MSEKRKDDEARDMFMYAISICIENNEEFIDDLECEGVDEGDQSYIDVANKENTQLRALRALLDVTNETIMHDLMYQLHDDYDASLSFMRHSKKREFAF